MWGRWRVDLEFLGGQLRQALPNGNPPSQQNKSSLSSIPVVTTLHQPLLQTLGPPCFRPETAPA